MRVVVTGGAGFIGMRLAERLLARGALAGPDGRERAITELVLFDPQPPPILAADPRLRFIAGDITDRAVLRQAIAAGTASVFHFAAVVSAEAEADFGLGMRVNLDGTRAVLEACRALGTAPRVIFASSLAVYGGALPAQVGEATPPRPESSYGAQKAMAELMVGDYSRKGFIDGRALRFPTIVVRPGRPNRAASSFASAIIREPLAGKDAVCPVAPETAMAILSPRCLVAAIEQMHDLPAAQLGADRIVQLPGITVTVAEMIAALGRVGGAACVARIRFARDATIERIVASWPRALDAARARGFGITADRDIDAIIAAFVADDLAGQKAMAAP